MATPKKVPAKGTKLKALIGGKPVKAGDEVVWRGAVWNVENDGAPYANGLPTLALKGYASAGIPLRECSWPATGGSVKADAPKAPAEPAK